MEYVNIGGDKNDPYYNYRMKSIRSNIENRRDGAKTVVLNLGEIAHALGVDGQHIAKFFSIELNAVSEFDQSSNQAVVEGAHQSSELAKLLDKFIDMFIVCPRCSLPDTSRKVNSKQQVVRLCCNACGYDGVIRHHPLQHYLLNLPSPQDNVAKATGKSRKKQSQPESERKEVIQPLEFDLEQDLVVPGEAPQTLQHIVPGEREMGDIVPGEVGNGPQQIVLESPLETLRSFLQAEPRTSPQILAQLQHLQSLHNLDESSRCRVLVDAVFDPSRPHTLTDQVSTHVTLLKQVAQQPQSSRALISAFESLCGKGAFEPLMARFAVVLHVLYDQGVLHEDVLLEWYDSSPQSSSVPPDIAVELRQRVQPLIQWLRYAEEES